MKNDLILWQLNKQTNLLIHKQISSKVTNKIKSNNICNAEENCANISRNKSLNVLRTS